MSDAAAARPGQVTVAGWAVVVASVVVVVSGFDQLASVRSVDTRDAVQRWLDQPPGSGLGLDVDTVLGLLTASAYVAALCAAASAILGWFVLRRDRVARRVLTVLAVPLFLTGLASGGFFPAVVAGATLLLWAPPARAWFRDASSLGSSTQGFRDASSLGSPTQGSSDVPSPASDTGTSSVAAPPPARPPLAPVPGPPTAASLLLRRPDPVVWSCLVTWAFSAIAVVGLLLSLVLLLGEGTSVITEARSQTAQLESVELSDRALYAGVLVLVVGCLVWAVAAIVLAVLVWRGVAWARVVLAVSAGLAGGLGLLSLVGGTLFAVPLVVGCLVVLRLLLSSRAAQWCRRPPVPPGR